MWLNDDMAIALRQLHIETVLQIPSLWDCGCVKTNHPVLIGERTEFRV
jgi:hypothetical protein